MKRYPNVVFVLILISILAASCGGNDVKQDQLPDLGTIKVGYLPIITYAPIYIAYEKGYFEEQGLEVELTSFASSSYMMPLLATGDLDVGDGQTGTELINAIHQDLDIKIVGPTNQEKEGYISSKFLVRKDLYDSGTITEPADLKGAVIATNVERGVVEYMTAELLKEGGLTIDDIQFVLLPFSDINVAIANQAIDGGLFPEPLASMAVDSGDAVILKKFSEIFPGATLSTYFFGERLLQPENREIGVRFFMALMKAIRELNTEDGYNDENVGYIAKYVNNPPEYIKTNRHYYDPNGEFDEAALLDAMNYYIERGYTEVDVLPDPELLIDLSFLKEAVEEMGPFEE